MKWTEFLMMGHQPNKTIQLNTNKKPNGKIH